MSTGQDKAKIEIDILEIDSVLYNPCGFDIEKAKQIIKKHNATNKEVAIYNSPARGGWVQFEQATPEMLANNLVAIRVILCAELAKDI